MFIGPCIILIHRALVVEADFKNGRYNTTVISQTL